MTAAAATGNNGSMWDPLSAIAERVPELKSVLIGAETPAPNPAPAPMPNPTPAPSQPPASHSAQDAIDAASGVDPTPPVATPSQDDSMSGLGVPTDVMSRFTTPPPATTVTPTAPGAEGVPDHVKAQGEKAVETWKSLKDERNLFKTERDTLKTRAEQAEAKLAEAAQQALSATEKQELETLRQRAIELEDKMGKYDLTATQGFKEKYDSKLDALYSKGVRILMARQIPQDEAVKVMREAFTQPDRRDAVLMDLPGSVQGAILSLVTDMDVIREDREGAVTHWKEQKELLKEEGSRAASFQIARDAVQDTTAAIQAVTQEGNWLFQTSEKDPEWNDQVDKRRLTVQAILRSSSPVELAKWVAEGVTAKVTRDLYATTYARLREVTSELNSVVKRKPSLGGGMRVPAAPVAGKPKPISPDRFLENEFPQ